MSFQASNDAASREHHGSWGAGRLAFAVCLFCYNLLMLQEIPGSFAYCWHSHSSVKPLVQQGPVLPWLLVPRRNKSLILLGSEDHIQMETMELSWSQLTMPQVLNSINPYCCQSLTPRQLSSVQNSVRRSLKNCLVEKGIPRSWFSIPQKRLVSMVPEQSINRGFLRSHCSTQC